MTASHNPRLLALMFAARTRMDREFDQKTRVADLAADAGMTVFRFIRVFTATFGETPGRYLRRRRMECAAALLSGTTLPIREVGRRSGYASAGTFSDSFRQDYGMTPTEYRSRHRG